MAEEKKYASKDAMKGYNLPLDRPIEEYTVEEIEAIKSIVDRKEKWKNEQKTPKHRQ